MTGPTTLPSARPAAARGRGVRAPTARALRAAGLIVALTLSGLAGAGCGDELAGPESGAITQTQVRPRVVIDGLVELSARTRGQLFVDEVVIHAPGVEAKTEQRGYDILASDPEGHTPLLFRYSLARSGLSGQASSDERSWDLSVLEQNADSEIVFRFRPLEAGEHEIEALGARAGYTVDPLAGYTAFVRGYIAVRDEAGPLATALATSGETNSGDPDGSPASGDPDGAPAIGETGSGDPDGAPASGDPDGAPASGDPDGAPASGDPDGSPASGDPDGSPASGDPDGAPASGDPDGAPASGDPDGAPADGDDDEDDDDDDESGDPDGAPASGDPDGAPASGDPDGAPADGIPASGEPGLIVPGGQGAEGNGGQMSGNRFEDAPGSLLPDRGNLQIGTHLVPFVIVLDTEFDLTLPSSLVLHPDLHVEDQVLPIDLHVDADRLFSVDVLQLLGEEAEGTDDDGSVTMVLGSADTYRAFAVEADQPVDSVDEESRSLRVSGDNRDPTPQGGN